MCAGPLSPLSARRRLTHWVRCPGLSRHNGYSGLQMFDGMIAAAFNMIFTAFPILFVAAFERDVDDAIMMRHSQLYIFSQQVHTASKGSCC